MLSEPPAVTPTGRYNESESARLLGVDRKTLARWRAGGIIRPCRIGTRVYYRGIDLTRIWNTR